MLDHQVIKVEVPGVVTQVRYLKVTTVSSWHQPPEHTPRSAHLMGIEPGRGGPPNANCEINPQRPYSELGHAIEVHDHGLRLKGEMLANLLEGRSELRR